MPAPPGWNPESNRREKLSGPTARTPVALEGIAFPIAPMFFRYWNASRYAPPNLNFALSQPRGRGGRGIAAQAALWRVSGISLWNFGQTWGLDGFECWQSFLTRPKYPPYRETGVAIPLSPCVSCGIADYRCYTPLLSLKMAYRNPKTDLSRGVSQKKLASEAYRAIEGVARNSIANRTIVGH